MASAPKVQVVAQVLKLTKATACVGGAVVLVMKVFVPVTRWRLRRIPGTVFKPVLGDALQLLLQDPTHFVHGLCVQHHGTPVFKYWVCSVPVVIVRNPKLARDMLNRCDTRPGTVDVDWAPSADRRPWEGVLLFINGSQWVRGRQALEESVMHASALKAHAPSMQAAADRLLEALDKRAATSKPVNVRECCMALALDVIVKVVFDIELHSDGLVASQASPEAVLQSAKAALSVGAKADTSLLTPEQIGYGWWDKYPVGSPEFGKRFVSSAVILVAMAWRKLPTAQILRYPFPSLAPVWRLLARVAPDKTARVMLKMMRSVRHSCVKLIDDWKARQQHLTPTTSDGRQLGLLSCMLSASTSDEVIDDVLSLVLTSLMAGYDTTGNNLSMCLYYLSKYPEVQRQAQQEVDSVLGGKVPDSKDMKDLPYLDAFIKEVLRLATLAPIIARRPSSDYTDPTGAFRIPAGTTVMFPLYSYHRDPSIWPRPLEFLPERFLPGHEDLAPTDPEMFFPFGAGARRCPGMRFALLELRLALARMLQRFEFRPAPGAPEPVMSTSLVYAPDKVLLNVIQRASAVIPV